MDILTAVEQTYERTRVEQKLTGHGGVSSKYISGDAGPDPESQFARSL